MKAIEGDVEYLVVKPAKSGWVIEGWSGRMSGLMLAGISDDEGLVEWFQEQLGFDGHKLQARPPNPGPEAKPAEAAIAPPPVSAGATQVRHMVDRFLSWKLPENFAPDGGITLTTSYDRASGTNLFDASQAEAMVRHMLEGMPVSDGEESYRAYRTSIPVEADGSRESLKQAREMFEKWIADALPASDGGQVHFGRALGESLSDAIKAYLERAPLDGLLEALAPFAEWAKAERKRADDMILWNVYDAGNVGSYREATLGNLRALIRAAGLWTQEMQAAPAQAEAPSAAPVAADTTQPQADRVETDAEIVDGDLAHKDNPAGQGMVDDDQEF